VAPGEANLFGQRQPTAAQQELDAKRDYNIALREKRYTDKQNELAGLRRQKKLLAEKNLEERRRQEATKRQMNRQQGTKKKQTNMEDDYRDKNREAAIARREERWQTKMKAYITNLLDTHQQQCDQEQEAKTGAKTRQLLKWKDASKKRADARQSRELKEENRLEKINKRAQVRLQNEMAHCDELKQEVEEHLEYKMECMETGIHTKVTYNDLVKSLVPVPPLSKLLCEVKSKMDEINYLRNVDLEQQAKLVEKSPLMYVKGLNDEHEKNRLPVPSAVSLANT